MILRVVLIILLGPVITAVVGLPVFGEGFFLVLVAYPILVACSTLCAPLVLSYLTRTPRSVLQVLLVAAIGFAGGGLIAFLLFRSNPGGMEHTLPAVFSYGSIGALHAAVLWCLSSFGPLRIVGRDGATPL